MANIRFEYLYRDEYNYKTFGEVIFANPNGLSLASIHQCITGHLMEGAWFYPEQWGIPKFSCHQVSAFGAHDWLWYEYDQVGDTNEAAGDGLVIEEFLQRLELGR
ncbi:MAG: hypothetical protein JEZ14_26825 [Marinilabiliaceae bacterium]|nr:hypothetical protein [Marinilabiliaceae bacterium]